MAFSTTKSGLADITTGQVGFTWTLADTSGNSASVAVGPATAISIQAVLGGTPGTTTVQASNDDTTFAALPTTIAITASGNYGVAVGSLGFRYYRLALTGGDGTSTHTFKIVVTQRRA